ncbi:MAG: hypothetical protein QHH00_03380 [Methanomassiliicoccales archaeon]|jgi:hypothetical protein|nr:hypothetical protein [Methanomassiliicoccales archaeon]
MSYRIPSAEILSEAIKEALSSRSMIPSQKALSSLVNQRLKVVDSAYTATEERIRRILIDKGLGKIEIHAREGEERSKAGRCPVCSGRMKRIRNQTIFGGTVTLGYKCMKCPYWTGLKRRIPIRYVFYGDERRAGKALEAER